MLFIDLWIEHFSCYVFYLIDQSEFLPSGQLLLALHIFYSRTKIIHWYVDVFPLHVIVKIDCAYTSTYEWLMVRTSYISMKIMSTLYYINMLSLILIVQAHWNNSLLVDMSL
jgi:hypothetical protein